MRNRSPKPRALYSLRKIDRGPLASVSGHRLPGMAPNDALGTAKATKASDQHGRFLWRNYVIAR